MILSFGIYFTKAKIIRIYSVSQLIMFKFKQTPEDFIVREVSDEDTLKFISKPISNNIFSRVLYEFFFTSISRQSQVKCQNH